MSPLAPSRSKRLGIVLFALVTVAIVVTVALLGDGPVDVRSLSGTMGGTEGLEIEAASLGWSVVMPEGAGGLLTDEFDALLTLAGSKLEAVSGFAFFLSRDDRFDAGEDCLVERKSVQASAGGSFAVRFRPLAYEAGCVDAGTWFAAIRVEATGQWIRFEETVRIEGGRADFELAEVPKDMGWSDPLQIGVDVFRKVSEAGLEGLLDHPLEVWLRRGRATCFLGAPSVTLARDPLRRLADTWETTRVDLEVGLKGARRVESDGDLDQLLARGGAPVLAGPCPMDEGEWLVAVGPNASGRIRTGTVRVHAPPVWIDDAPIELTLSAGDRTTVDVAAYNPSARPVLWSGGGAGIGDDDWLGRLVGQQLTGRDTTALEITVSAASLRPGRYSGTFRIRFRDWYETEHVVPVTLTVNAGAAARAPDSGEQPGGIELANYPNPFRGRTTIRVQLQEAGQVRLAVYDVSGREVRLVADEWMSGGLHEIPFDAGVLPSGTYLYRIVTGSAVQTRTMTLVN